MTDLSPTPLTNALHADLVKRSEKPDWIVGTAYEEMQEHAKRLEARNAELVRVLTSIRDNTFKSAVTLRALADRALTEQQGGKHE